MKKLLFLPIFILWNLYSSGQVFTDSIKAGWGSLDYTVPESPAFDVLGTSPDNILKPTSVRSVALSVGNYFFSSGNIIPKNLAVEFNPLLFNPKASLNDYNNHKFLYRSRISFGTNQKGDGSYDLAEGIRLTIIDKTDLRTNVFFLKSLASFAVKRSDFTNQAIAFYHQNINSSMTIIELSEKYSSDSEFKATIDSLAGVLAPNEIIFPDKITHFRDSIKETLWNAPIWEVGAAARQSSRDSLIKNVGNTNKVDVWTTFGMKLTKNGQLLIGGKYDYSEDSLSEWQSNVSAGARVYYGKNAFKGYLQAQYNYLNKESTWAISLGSEFSIINGLWADIAFDISIDKDGKTSMRPALNIKFGTPENKKFGIPQIN